MDCPVYIGNCMSKLAGIELTRARNLYRDRQLIYGETIAAALGTDATKCLNKGYEYATAYITSPPLRPDPTTPEFLMKLLAK